MSSSAKAMRNAALAKYLLEKEKGGDVKTVPTPLRKDVHHQIHADMAEEHKIGTRYYQYPNEWVEQYQGFYRSAVRTPFYAAIRTVAKAVERKEDILPIVKEHFEQMKLDFEDWNERLEIGDDILKNKMAAELQLKPDRSQTARRTKGKPKPSVEQNKPESGDTVDNSDFNRKSGSGEDGDEVLQSPEPTEAAKTPQKARRDHRRVPGTIRTTSHRLGAWRFNSHTRLTEQTAHETKSQNFDYSDAAFAAKRLNDDTKIVVHRTTKSSERTRAELIPSDRVLSKVNKSMQRFAENYDSVFKPDLSSTSKHHNDVVPESKIRTEVLVNDEDRDGKLPSDHCLLYATQGEARRQEYLLRQQCKALEVAEPLLVAAYHCLDKFDDEQSRDLKTVLEGVQNAHNVHMRAATELLGTTIQQRTRDNCIRKGYSKEQVDQCFSEIYPPNEDVKSPRETLCETTKKQGRGEKADP
jgi:hypothetical protein